MSEALIPIQEVVKRTGYSRPSIYRMIRAGTFPQQVHFGRRKVLWRSSDVDRWVAIYTMSVPIFAPGADPLEELLG